MHWTPERHNQLRTLAAAGRVKKQIAEEMGMTVWGVGEHARRLGIKLELQTPEMKAIFAERVKQRERDRCTRARAANAEKRRLAREAALKAWKPEAPAAPKPKMLTYELRKTFSLGELSKSGLQALLADAVRNTAQMQVGEG